MDPEELSKQGNYEQALAALKGQTSNPVLLMRFGLLVRLQRFNEALGTIQQLGRNNPEMTPLFRELADCVRSEQAMAARLVDGKAAQERGTVGLPPAYAFLMVQAALHHANGDFTGARQSLDEARSVRPVIAGELTTKTGRKLLFADLEDSDELTGAVLPVYGSGEVIDLAYSDLAKLRLVDGHTSFDVQWIPVVATLWDRREVGGRLPSLYPGSGIHADRELRTGRMTGWNLERGYAVGFGQRDLRFYEEPGGKFSLLGIEQVRELKFKARRAGPTPGQEAKPGAGAPEASRPWWQRMFGR